MIENTEISYADIVGSEADAITTLNQKNGFLANILCVHLEKDKNRSISKDVFAFLLDNAEKIKLLPDQLHFEGFLCELLEGEIKDVAWFKWATDYYLSSNHENQLDIDYMSYAITVAIKEKGMPLQDFIEIVECSDGNETILMEKLDSYKKNSQVEKPDAEIAEVEATSYCEDDFSVEVSDNLDIEAPDSEIRPEQYGYSDMFENLLEVMTYKNSDEQNLSGIQNDMNVILAKFQMAATELNSFSVDIFKAWEKDRDEIKKLKSLYEIQKNFLANMQNKLNEQKSEISYLRNKLADVEKKEIKRESLNHKILEIQGLMSELEATNEETEYRRGR